MAGHFAFVSENLMTGGAAGDQEEKEATEKNRGMFMEI
jgi:hypothetical protein